MNCPHYRSDDVFACVRCVHDQLAGNPLIPIGLPYAKECGVCGWKFPERMRHAAASGCADLWLECGACGQLYHFILDSEGHWQPGRTLEAGS